MTVSGSKDTLEAIFKRAIEIEYKAADIYNEFSQLFSHIQEVSDFWKELTEDEIGHANMLQDIVKPLTIKQLQSPCDKKISEKTARIQCMIKEISIESIKNLDDAYDLAHELEFSEVNAVFESLATEFVSSEQRKQFVVSEITKHQKKLLVFSQNFGDQNWRKGISIHPVQYG